MEQRTDLLEIIDFINPASLDYQNWINVGMALKHEGYAAVDWDAWSRQDPHRYQDVYKRQVDHRADRGPKGEVCKRAALFPGRAKGAGISIRIDQATAGDTCPEWRESA